MTRLERVQPVFGGQGETLTTRLLKECKGLAVCVRELHRIRHKLMQVIRGEEVKARTKVSAHRRYTRRGHRSAVTHANIQQYTFSQDSTQLQQARHSVWRDNHVIATTPPSQTTAAIGAATSHTPSRRTLTGPTTRARTKITKTTNNRKRKRRDPRRSPRVPRALSCHPYRIRTLLQGMRLLMYMITCLLMCIRMKLLIHLCI